MIKTYINNEKVQPAPSVGEVDLETICSPFEEHLNDKNIGEDLICIFENDFNHSPLLNIDVLKRLFREKEESMSSDLKAKDLFYHISTFPFRSPKHRCSGES